MIRVALVDNHVLLRHGTRAFLAAAPDIDVVAETGQGEEALALARHLSLDVVILDIRIDGLSGIDVARILRQELPGIKVLILSAYPYETYVRALFAIGVHGYLLKNVSGLELIEAVRAVHQGNQVLSAEIAAKRPGRAIAGALSEREREVLALVFTGASNKEIAQQLGIGIRTAESYLRFAMAKLGAHTRTEAINTALRRGILVPDGGDALST